MPPMLLSMLPFIAKGIGGLFQAGAGAIGMSAKRPEYQIPDAQNQATALAALSASGNMGGYDQAKSNIGTSTANALTAAREAGNPNALIGQIQSNENVALNRLDAQNAGFKDQKQGDLQRALMTQGEYQDRAWQMNEFAPYADKVQQGRQMFGAGLSNMFGAMTDGMNYNAYKDLLNSGNVTSNANAGVSGGNMGYVAAQPVYDFLNKNQNPLLSLMKNAMPLIKIAKIGE